MRRGLSTVRSPALLEAACAVSRLGPFDSLARHVFFGRGSFPDETHARRRLAAGESRAAV